MHCYEIIIVGAGPSGSSTAIQLANLNPDLACRVLLLDKANFPRPKLCAGGVTNNADIILKQLGVLVDVPALPVHTSKFIFPTGCLTLSQESHFRVLRREEFDHCLFRAAKDRGIDTRDGEHVENVHIGSEGVFVQTTKEAYKAKIIIGADGANSTVRKILHMPRTSRIMMVMEIHAPANRIQVADLKKNMAIFDFTIMNEGVEGYCWIFPSISENFPVCSLGIMESSSNRDKLTSLKSAFTRWLAAIAPNWQNSGLRAHPALRYEPRASCSSYRALLVGDAAGVDPLFGEGITSALALGMLAAQSAYEALGNKDFSFSDYERRIRSSFIGSIMRRRRTVAHRFYGSRALGQRELQYSDLLDWVTPRNPSGSPTTAIWEDSSH